MHYQPLTETNRREIFEKLGISDFKELIQGIPKGLLNPSFNLPDALPESILQRVLTGFAARNSHAGNSLSFLGGGSYEHFIPSAVASVISRHEFYTAYTPYQPEASQGTLQSIFEFQSLMAELTGLDVSNASHYDGSTAMAEAAVLALRQTGRTEILVARSVHPEYRQVLQTYLADTNFKIREIPFKTEGELDREWLERSLNDQVAGVILQTPNFFGIIEDLEGLADKIHAAGALLVLAVNPLSLGVIRTPGEWGADIAVGEGQPLGIPVQLGGPYLGFFVTTRALMRRIPGRLAGLTEDRKGKRAYCLTLQAREQHIRRERAASNICTNQALCALAACVYMTLLGKAGIREVGEINMDRGGYLHHRLQAVSGFQADHQPFFNEFVVKSNKPVSEVLAKLQTAGIQGGVELGRWYPEFKNAFLVCATETKSREDLDRFVEELSRC